MFIMCCWLSDVLVDIMLIYYIIHCFIQLAHFKITFSYFYASVLLYSLLHLHVVMIIYCSIEVFNVMIAEDTSQHIFRKNRHVYNAASKMDKPVPLLDRQSSEFKDKRKLPRNLELEFTSSVLSRENCNNGIQAVGHGYSDEGHEADDFTLPCSIMVSAGMQESRQAHSGESDGTFCK